ncbi:unnamed protein product [Phaedon cochleariae]|uniref:C2H2-type domain-containing protein n=1 Tax=Phaedon cochleariae TaxID=80249 RepID=A0A9N9SHS7_PHACE|nr:unnamed protein product [Phaedon cochleariae]
MICFCCLSTFNGLKSITEHYRIVHKLNETSTYECLENDCQRKFGCYNSYRKHITRTHFHTKCNDIGKQSKIDTISKSPNSDRIGNYDNSSSQSEVLHHNADEVINNVQTDNVVEDEPLVEPSEDDVEAEKEAFLLAIQTFTSELYALNLPRSYVQIIIEKITKLLNHKLVTNLKNTILRTILGTMTDENSSSMQNIMSRINTSFCRIQNPFEGALSEYTRLKQINASGYLIKPCEKVVGSYLTIKNNAKKPTTISYENLTIQTVDMKRVLKNVFEMPNFFKKKTLKMRLEKTLEGKVILMFAEKNKINRRHLAKFLVEEKMDGDVNRRITKEEFERMAAEIVDAFPSETKEIYFIPSRRIMNKKISAKGILYDHYCNKRKRLIKLGLVQKSSASAQITSGNIAIELSLNEQEDITWLRNSIEPWTIVLEKWKLPADDLPNSEVLPLLILPLYFPPKKIKNTSWRPSKMEIQEGFILFVKNVADIQPHLFYKRNKYEKLKLTMQPIPIFIGENYTKIEKSFVSISDIFWEVQSPLQAIDICFKCFHVFDAKYPVESDMIWLFIQQTLYDIHTSYDTDYVSLKSLQCEID